MAGDGESTKYQLSPSERLSLQSSLPLRERWPAEAPHLTNHAIGQWGQRMPTDAVPMPLAWLRGEDVEHPEVFSTTNPATPPVERARVYNHADRYYAIFIVGPGYGDVDEAVVTVYNEETYGYPPTRAYLRAFGPHDDAPDGETVRFDP